jgi:hypothetical protein
MRVTTSERLFGKNEGVAKEKVRAGYGALLNRPFPGADGCPDTLANFVRVPPLRARKHHANFKDTRM